MEDSQDKQRYSALQKAAQVVSDIFSPLLVPTYGMAMVMWITPLQVLPERTRIGATLGVAIITAVIPLCLLLLLYRTGKISDMSISQRKQRTLPMSIGVAAYVGAAIYLKILHAPVWLPGFFIGAAIATAVALIVTLRWKISAHSIAIGGLAAVMLWIAATRLATVNAMLWLTAVIIIGGVTASARLVLDRHTPAQVCVGWLWGLICVFACMTVSIF